MTRVALVQLASPESESPTDRIARVDTLLRSHAHQGIELFVLPELWSAGYFAFEQYADRAEALDGPTVRMAQRVAADLEAWVHLGSFVERDPDGKLYNTAALIDPTGAIAHTYRKIHVFGYQSLEAQLLTPGNSLAVTPTPIGPLASTTCYDLRFPGLWLELGARGAHAVAVPAAWPAARREHWQLLTQTRALEHQIWVLAVNTAGTQAGTTLGGCSRIIDPWGRIIAEASPTDEEIIIADLDADLVTQVRTEFPVLGDRLTPDAYPALGTHTHKNE